MILNEVIIFGANEYAMEIAKKIQYTQRKLHLYVLDESSLETVRSAGFEASLFDLSDDWDTIAERHDVDELTAFSALEDDAKNIFLTISLRASFENIMIIALATDEESASKLKMAGANKVIPVKQTTANMIVSELETPITSDVMFKILYDKSDLKIAQLRVAETSEYVGSFLHDVKWNEIYGVIVLAVVDQDISTSFTFTSRGQKHRLDPGDMMIVIGYDHDIRAFERVIGGEINE